MSEKKEIQTAENAKLYELGFHIIPTVTEEEVTDVFSKIKDIINKNNGLVVKEGNPKLIKLAYTIVKKIGSKNERFNSAFFAWIKFNAESSDIEGLKSSLDSSESIIRYIIVKTVDDDEHSTIKLAEEEEPEDVEDVEDETNSKDTEKEDEDEDDGEVADTEESLEDESEDK